MADAAPHGDLSVLLARAAAGDEAAWSTLTARFSRLVWAVARSYRMSPDDCADAVQNTWLRLLENLERIQRPDALPGWLTTTARHEALGVLRRRRRELLSRDDDVGMQAADPQADDLDGALLEDERDAALWRCFHSLSARCQQLLRVLMGADRPAYTEVAVELGMPIGSIGPTRMRCLDQLRSLATQSGYPFLSQR